jgi:hypothetical protein
VADYCCLAKASRRAFWEVRKKSRTAYLLLAPPPLNKPKRRKKKALLGPHLKCPLDTRVLKTQIDIHVPIGSDAAFAVVVGTGARAVYEWWIGRIAKLFKAKGFWRRAVPLSGGLPAADMSAVCEWYSPIPGTANRKYYLRDNSDRT